MPYDSETVFIISNGSLSNAHEHQKPRGHLYARPGDPPRLAGLASAKPGRIRNPGR